MVVFWRLQRVEAMFGCHGAFLGANARFCNKIEESARVGVGKVGGKVEAISVRRRHLRFFGRKCELSNRGVPV